MRSNKGSSELYMIVLFTLIFFVGYHTFYPILPLYIVDVGASKFELGLILSVFRGFAILTILLSGLIALRIGKWLTLLFSMSLQLASFILYSITPSSIFLYPITILYATSFAAFGPISMSIALDSAPSTRRGTIMGRYFGAIGVAMIIGPTIASFLALHFDFKTMLIIASLLPLFCISFFLVSLKRKLITLQINSSYDQKGSFKTFVTMRRILLLRNVFIICFVQLSFYIATGVFDTLFPIYARESLWLTASTISLLYAARGLPNSIIRIPIGALTDRIGRLAPIIISHSLAFLAIFLIPDMKEIWILALLMGIYGVGWGARIPSSAAFLADNVKSDEINIASSLLWLNAFLGMTLGSLLAGSTTLILPIPTILKISSFFIILGILSLYFIKRTRDFETLPRLR
ncbi:MAG: MFS transporter [Candidatus Bathyarchaeota archaeon]|nr:MFS transporter [Candidatus Bathyarchaeota archaeon]